MTVLATATMTLSELKLHETAYVDSVTAGPHGSGLVSRLHAMGFLPNQQIRLIRKARMNGPLQVKVGSTTHVAIRLLEADMVIVRPVLMPNSESETES